MNEALYKAMILTLGRAGIDVQALEKEENPTLTTEQVAEAILGQDRFTKPLVDEKLKEQNGIIVSKMNRQAENLGIDKSKVEEAAGDIAKLFALVGDHINATAGKPDDENLARIKELSTKNRELELEREQLVASHQQGLEALKAEQASTLSSLKKEFDVKNAFSSLNLADNVRDNLDLYSKVVNERVSDLYEIKEGKVFKKGTEEPLFKEGSSDQHDLRSLIELTAKDLKLEKVTNVSGGGDPNKGGSSKKPENTPGNPYGDALK